MTLSWTDPQPIGVADAAARFRLDGLSRYDRGDDPGPWRYAIIDLADRAAGDPIDELNLRMDQNSDLAQSLIIPRMYREKQRASWGATRSYPVYVRRGILDHLEGVLEGVVARLRCVAGIVPDRRLTDETKPGEALGPDIMVPAETVLTGIIDNGIAFASDAFMEAGQTRIAQCWIMDAPAPPMSPVSQGRLIEQGEIQTLLNAHTRAGLLDEAGFYREAGLIDMAEPGFKPAAMRLSHGTHVASLAAGFTGPLPSRPVLCAELPTPATGDVGSEDLVAAILMALDHILVQSTRFKRPDGKRPPLALVLSYGNFAGPHDGTGAMETHLATRLAQELADGMTTRLVLPAGNGNLSRCHASLGFAGTNTRTLRWALPPDDRTLSTVEIRTPALAQADVPGAVRVSLRPYGGPPSPVLGGAVGLATALKDDGGNTIATFSFDLGPAKESGVFTITTAPTENLANPAGLAAPGEWLIHVERGTLPATRKVEAWIERDETLRGFPREGRQSRFVDEHYATHDARGAPKDTDDVPPNPEGLVWRTGTLSGFATGVRNDTVVIGAYVESDGLPSLYSAHGPGIARLDPALSVREGPDAVEVGDDSPVRRGIFGAGSRRGSIVRLSGTSVAAPQTTRLIADKLAADPAFGQLQVHTQASSDDPAPPVPKKRVGRGRLKRRLRIGGVPNTEL
ncbi:hypothetical protein [Acuticoccus kandeliae]|uniref:hypothetical protein n=1 Tax=Acuticoccus kandeliae TaxID=2073160 RepID=UPI000D3E5A73|nr:hypothetical protein [Acuticoccus kandeliae]